MNKIVWVQMTDAADQLLADRGDDSLGNKHL